MSRPYDTIGINYSELRKPDRASKEGFLREIERDTPYRCPQSPSWFPLLPEPQPQQQIGQPETSERDHASTVALASLCNN
jgi:hypothetical protein